MRSDEWLPLLLQCLRCTQAPATDNFSAAAEPDQNVGSSGSCGAVVSCSSFQGLSSLPSWIDVRFDDGTVAALSPTQLRSMLKFVGVKPQTATLVSHWILAALPIVALTDCAGMQLPPGGVSGGETERIFVGESPPDGSTTAGCAADSLLSRSTLPSLRLWYQNSSSGKAEDITLVSTLCRVMQEGDRNTMFLHVDCGDMTRMVEIVLAREKTVMSLLLDPSSATPTAALVSGAPRCSPNSVPFSGRDEDATARCRIAFALRMQQRRDRPLLVLVGGTSGCGKSTLAHLLANRLGIDTVISTDSVREALRVKRKPDEYPELFASTYEAHLSTRQSDTATSHDSPCNAAADDSDVIRAFETQAHYVLQVLDRLLDMHLSRGESVLVEGVHLLPSYCTYKAHVLMESAGVLCIPLMVHIVKPEKHLLRFAIRSKSMTLKPQENKYVTHFDAIRAIQNYVVRESRRMSQEALASRHGKPMKSVDILLVNNTNVDRSLSSIHMHVLRCVDWMEGLALCSDGAHLYSPSSSILGSSPPMPSATMLPSSTLLLPKVNGKAVVRLLMRRRVEKQQRRARSAEASSGGASTSTGCASVVDVPEPSPKEPSPVVAPLPSPKFSKRGAVDSSTSSPAVFGHLPPPAATRAVSADAHIHRRPRQVTVSSSNETDTDGEDHHEVRLHGRGVGKRQSRRGSCTSSGGDDDEAPSLVGS